MISFFNVHLSNHQYLIEAKLRKLGLPDTSVISVEQFIGNDRQPQLKVWYRDPRTTEERDNDDY
jgi:hypothetical protein